MNSGILRHIASHAAVPITPLLRVPSNHCRSHVSPKKLFFVVSRTLPRLTSQPLQSIGPETRILSARFATSKITQLYFYYRVRFLARDIYALWPPE
ncbi:Predicted protein [Komagataella phaffii CBS 7435]|nr:Predicted protein [Komagataella phaffii CBS 7435]